MERIRPKRRPAFGSNSQVGQRGARTQAKILSAGLQILDKSGYHGARVEAIAALAGCSRPTFYQYFADKAELFQQMTAQLDDELAELLQTLEPIDRSQDGRNALYSWLEEFVALHRRSAPVFRLFEATVGSNEFLSRGGEARLLGIGGRFADSLRSPRDTLAPLDRYAALVFSTISRTGGLIPPTLAMDRLVAALADWSHRCFFGPIDGVNTGRSRAASDVVPHQGRTESAPSTEERRLSHREAGSRERLLEAARDVFGRLGYEATRVDDIVAETGVSHGTLYRYFSGKEDIFRTLARPAMDDMLATLDELPRPRGGYHSWSRRLHQTYATHGNLFSVWMESEGTRTALAPRMIQEAVTVVGAALHPRAFGDREVDTLLLIAHAASGPYIARVYPQFARTDLIAGTAEILECGFFGTSE
jgi:AcrR family transcriptional regulator